MTTSNIESFQSKPIEETLRHFKTSPHGLTSQEAHLRLKHFGKNVLKEETISKLTIFFRQFHNILIYILLIASLISISIGEWADFTVIVGVIFINSLIGFWQELKAEYSIAALKKMTESRNKVMRDGSLLLLVSTELVPGDYLIFHEGEVVTCDVRLVDSAGLMVDESSMTGESAPIVKDHTVLLPADTEPYALTNMLLAGTTVLRGTGRGIVVRTGKHTYLAQIAEKAQEASPETPLTKALQFFAKRYIVLLTVLFSGLGIVGFFQGRSIVNLAYILLASLVSSVPEGLPIVITLVMVIGAIALSKKKSLVRYLPAVETLGSASVIAADKTGTITEGKLIVKEVFAIDLEKLKFIAALCNDAHEGSGDPLDVALSDWVENGDEIKQKFPRKWAYSFDTRLMLMATVNRLNGQDELLVKGAYEALLEKAINRHDVEKLETALQTFLDQGLRVLAFGCGVWEKEDPSSWKIQIVGLIGFLDPPKEGVKEAVTFAKKAGIRVLMVTGDHPLTAQAVAQEVGIWTHGQPILTGKELALLSDDDLTGVLQKTTIFARILPEHKYRIVKLLQKSGQIVAVTGDGVNDVPALKAADLGIAMGGGTEAAKSASKMVLSDNNLKVIIDAIKNARIIADNIRKIIYYLASTSLQEITLIAVAILTSFPLPLTATQILWINIVTDGVQDKMFPFAKEEGDVMKRKPRLPEKQFLDNTQLIRILSFGLSIGLLCFFIYRHLLTLYEFPIVSTIMFTSVVVAQWANGIQSQKQDEPFFKNIKRSFTINPLIFLGSGLGAILQITVIYSVPHLFHSVPLSLEHWKYPILVFFLTFAFVEIRKWLGLLFFRAYK